MSDASRDLEMMIAKRDRWRREADGLRAERDALKTELASAVNRADKAASDRDAVCEALEALLHAWERETVSEPEVYQRALRVLKAVTR